jgi:hypothetical protein
MRWVAREQVAETIPHGLLHETCMFAFGVGESEDVEGGADVFDGKITNLSSARCRI